MPDALRPCASSPTHHPGGESRIVSLFSKLRPYLEATFDEAEPGTVYVITRYRGGRTNLLTQLLRISAQTSAESCEKPFRNMRSTRETELAENFPVHVVCRWTGNSQPVAAKFYLQVTDEHVTKTIVDDESKTA